MSHDFLDECNTPLAASEWQHHLLGHKKMVSMGVVNGEFLPWTSTGYLQQWHSRSPLIFAIKAWKVPKRLLIMFNIISLDKRHTPFPPCFGHILFFDMCSGTKSAGKSRPFHIPDGFAQIGQLMSLKRTWCQRWAISTIYVFVMW